MSLLETIKADQLQARKDKNKEVAGILTTLIGEIVIVGKNDGDRETTDQEALKVVIKFKKGVDEMLTMKISDEKKSTLTVESALYAKYLPTMLSEEKLREIVSGWKRDNYPDTPNVSGCMQALKRCYEGQYDGKMASQIVREIYG